MRFTSARVAAAACTTALLCITPLAAHASPHSERPTSSGYEAVLAAMQRDLHLDRAAAVRRLSQEARAAKLEAALVPRLGAGYAGSWFDATSGTLVVGVTNAKLGRTVRAAGGRAKMMRFSYATLNTVKTRLDMLGRSSRTATRGVVGWRVDPMRNRVVMTTIAGHEAVRPRQLAGLQNTVTFETASGFPTNTSDYLDGGEWIGSGEGCSVGFNASLTYSGSTTRYPTMMSAGHCAKADQVYGMRSILIGRWWFKDLSYDWALAGVTNTAYWMPGPWISLHDGNDGYMVVRGSQQRPIGSSVCKSGWTTKITCGVIKARNETVFKEDVQRWVYGVTRNTTCTEPGDSGGPTYSADGQAQGIVSTAYTTRGLCEGKFGRENRSWYVEVSLIQGYTGARVMTAN